MEYVGEYKDGKKHGKGRYTWSDGGIYIGNWKDGKEHGHGTYTSPVGTKYVGEWKEGKYDGQGTETLSNGWKYVGEWREGKPWNITIYGKSGIIIMKYVNGVEQKCNTNSSSFLYFFVSPVTNSQLILHRVREPPSKIPNSCKTNQILVYIGFS